MSEWRFRRCEAQARGLRYTVGKFFLGVLLVALLVGCAPAPVTGPEHFHAAKRLIFPVIMHNAQLGERMVWPWPRHGYGRTFVEDLDASALGTANWYHTWSPGCADGQQVPMVWGGGASEVDQLWACNDYRPVLIANEPERPEQANMSPAQVADVVYQVAWGGWRGEILCCGTWADQLDYNDAVVASYEARYGAWPATGWHVHAYSAASWSRDVQSVTRVRGAVEQVRRFVEHQRAAGRLGRGVVVSEYGVLSSRAWHSPAALVPALLTFEVGFRDSPDVVSWAWYSTADPVFSASDLLERDGRLTALGAVWRVAAR